MGELLVSIATISLSVVAILINIHQNMEIKKQNLFDRRLKLYLELMDLVNLYQNNQSILEKIDPKSVDFEFSFITNSSNLYMLADIMQNPLDYQKKVMFLTACENIRKDAQEFRFIYKKKYTKCADFIEAYANMIQQFHKQQVLIKKFEEHMKSGVYTSGEPLENDYVHKECTKLANSENGLFPAIHNIKELYEEIQNKKILEKIEKTIKF